jgi:3-oxoacyl-[acyl-carrier-protein] synthase I
MTDTLDIVWCGAVTPVGLDAFQTAAAIRARIAGFQESIPLTPPKEPLLAARIPARASVRGTPARWLTNLAARGIREALGHPAAAVGRLALILTLPEKVREHPALTDGRPDELMRQIESAAGGRFEEKYLTAEGGAGIAAGLGLARSLFRREAADACVVGGVDSLLNWQDVRRLRKAGRMTEPDIPQGLIPGEGSAFLLVTPAGRWRGAIASVLGVSSALEADDVLGPRFSQGRGFVAALRSAVNDGGIAESSVSFRVSTVNGERYAAWESMFSSARFYRTRRERLTTWYTASSVGEMGAASGAVVLLVAAMAIGGGYAPGPYAMCETSSETGLRAACLVGPAGRAPAPPFRPEGGAANFVRRKRQEATEK